MAQNCPVCRTRLWTHPILTPSKLTCPRCGAEFEPTVRWVYFRVLLLIVIALGLLLVLLVSHGNLAVAVFLVASVLLLWFLPRLIDLQHIGPELTPSEGVLDTKQLRLKVEDQTAGEKLDEIREIQRFRRSILFLLLVAALLIIVISRFAGLPWP